MTIRFTERSDKENARSIEMSVPATLEETVNAETSDLPEWGDHEYGVEKIPVEPYISPEVLEFEKREVFGKSWLMAGRISDLVKPGDYIVFPIESMDISVVVVKGKDDRLRAFHNVCTHRGAPLVNEASGRIRGAFVCPFHGWVFNLDGELRDVPNREAFGCLDVDSEHLHAVSVDVWGGFVWVNLDPTPTVSIADYLNPLGAAYDQYLANPAWSWSYGWRAPIKANWKLLIDAQIESYHVDQLHRKTIGGNIPGGNCRPTVFPESVGMPSFFNVYRNEVVGVQTPISLLSAEYGSTSLYTESERSFQIDGGEGVLKEHPRWVFDSFHLFPNVVMFLQRGQIFIQRTYPITPDECIWEVDFYHSERVETFGQLFNAEQGRIQIRDVLSEDLSMAERLQKSYKSGVIKSINLNKQEVPMRAFYHALERAKLLSGAGKVMS